MFEAAKNRFSLLFDMKGMGDLAFVLGVKIFRDRRIQTLGFYHEKYIKKILVCFRMKKTKLINIPIIMNHGLSQKFVQKILLTKN